MNDFQLGNMGDKKEHGNDPDRDATQANALYELLVKPIVLFAAKL